MCLEKLFLIISRLLLLSQTWLACLSFPPLLVLTLTHILASKPLYISVCSICLLSGRYGSHVFYFIRPNIHLGKIIMFNIIPLFTLPYRHLEPAVPKHLTICICSASTRAFLWGWWRRAHEQECDSAITVILLFSVAGFKWPQQLVRSTQAPCLGLIRSRRDNCRVHLFVMYSRYVHIQRCHPRGCWHAWSPSCIPGMSGALWTSVALLS